MLSYLYRCRYWYEEFGGEAKWWTKFCLVWWWSAVARAVGGPVWQHTRTEHTVTFWPECRFQVVLKQIWVCLRWFLWACYVPGFGLYSHRRVWVQIFLPTETYGISVVSERKNDTTNCWLALSLVGISVPSVRLRRRYVTESHVLQHENVKESQTTSWRSFGSEVRCFGTNLVETFLYCSTLLITFFLQSPHRLLTTDLPESLFHFSVSVRFICSVRQVRASYIHQIWHSTFKFPMSFIFLLKRLKRVIMLYIRLN